MYLRKIIVILSKIDNEMFIHKKKKKKKRFILKIQKYVLVTNIPQANTQSILINTLCTDPKIIIMILIFLRVVYWSNHWQGISIRKNIFLVVYNTWRQLKQSVKILMSSDAKCYIFIKQVRNCYLTLVK